MASITRRHASEGTPRNLSHSVISSICNWREPLEVRKARSMPQAIRTGRTSGCAEETDTQHSHSVRSFWGSLPALVPVLVWKARDNPMPSFESMLSILSSAAQILEQKTTQRIVQRRGAVSKRRRRLSGRFDLH
jgi:hypothetical protein